MNAPAARVRVKICGVTNRADAEAAIALGADALGFNLFPSSKRFIELACEAEWIAALPPFVTRVAVLVNAPFEEARRVAEHPGIDCVQFHGDEDEAFCAEFARLGRPFIKALRLGDAAAIEQATRFSTGHVLLDAQAGAAYGGTGTLIDLGLAAECARRHPQLTLILAGGLKPANVAEAVRAARPYAVDVASGVECDDDPRRKDAERMRAFLTAAQG
jgi:phosphoribosylanthranilate isomerase